MSLILTVIGVLAVQTFAQNSNPQPYIPSEFALTGLKYKWEGGERVNLDEIFEERWSSKLNMKYRENLYPNISGDGSWVIEYLEIVTAKNEIDYAFNQDTKYQDCDIDANYYPNFNISNQISAIKNGLANNYKGMQTVPWEKNATMYHRADYDGDSYYYFNVTNEVKYRTYRSRSGINVEEFEDGFMDVNWTIDNFRTPLCPRFNPVVIFE